MQVMRELPLKSVTFGHGSLQKWLVEGEVDFLEIFCGGQCVTMAAQEIGARAGEGLDKETVSYGRSWPLEDPETRWKAAWLITVALRPRATHTGTPCTRMCVIGANHGSPEEYGKDPLDEESLVLVDFSAQVAEHQVLTDA